MSSLTEVHLLPRETHAKTINPSLCFLSLPCTAPSHQNLAAASPEDSELPPGPSKGGAGAQESEDSPPPAMKFCVPSGLFGASPVEPSRELMRKFNLRKLTIPLVRIDPEAACRVLGESSSCRSSEQHTPDISAASPEYSELSPGPSRRSAGTQEHEASPEPFKKVFVTSVLFGASSVEPDTYKFQLQPGFFILPVPMDHQSPLVTVPESSSCTSLEQHSPAYCPSGREGCLKYFPAVLCHGQISSVNQVESFKWNHVNKTNLGLLFLSCLPFGSGFWAFSRQPLCRGARARQNTFVHNLSALGKLPSFLE